jgi:hypothetical protein
MKKEVRGGGDKRGREMIRAKRKERTYIPTHTHERKYKKKKKKEKKRKETEK